jgi:hypothetical protein
MHLTLGLARRGGFADPPRASGVLGEMNSSLILFRQLPRAPPLWLPGSCVIGSENIEASRSQTDSYGNFALSVYGLVDGTRFLAYQLGPAAYLEAGDRIAALEIPVLELRGNIYRAVLGYEDLKRDQS